tara:strand:- start:1361 stop:1681 length:321 start_codon:yes stop_codon:yes gene_type:complete
MSGPQPKYEKGIRNISTMSYVVICCDDKQIEKHFDRWEEFTYLPNYHDFDDKYEEYGKKYVFNVTNTNWEFIFSFLHIYGYDVNGHANSILHDDQFDAIIIEVEKR